jgi:hypothetical protein
MTGDLDDFVLSMLGTVHCRKCVGTSARGRVLPRRSPPPLYCPVDEGSREQLLENLFRPAPCRITISRRIAARHR